MDLQQSVTRLQREAEALEARCELRERELRARAAPLEAELGALEAEVAAEEVRLAQFQAEARQQPSRPVVTVARALTAAATLGLFTCGAAAARLELPHVSVGLFAGVWVAFLAGALRGR